MHSVILLFFPFHFYLKHIYIVNFYHSILELPQQKDAS